MRLVLASQSPSRLRLLRLAGIEPEVIVSAVDEEALAAGVGPLEPAAYVQLLATAKAEAVAGVLRAMPGRGGLVLGCDSAFVIDGGIHGKPHEPALARERWRAMRGRRGRLLTGHTLVDLRTGDARHGVASAELDFAEVADDEIDWYVASGEPLEVAGAFTLDGLAAPFITRIAGDPHAVVGLSLATLRRLALELGHAWTELV